MSDPHLNPFYTYNHDNELIENNLTRALIVTLRFLSAQARQALLTSLLSVANPKPDSLNLKGMPSFDRAEFRLQAHMDVKKSRRFARKYLLTIASYRDYALDEKSEQGAVEESLPVAPVSIPDAWIYDEAQGYCFLVEAKVGSNPLFSPQLAAHARDWFHIHRKDLPQHLIGLSWYDLADATHALLTATAEAPALNEQEEHLLRSLTQYLGFFGYRLFTGFQLDSLLEAPGIGFLCSGSQVEDANFDFDGPVDVPSFRLFQAQQGDKSPASLSFELISLANPPVIRLG